jgi:GntR family transcriptional regulator
LHLHHAEETIEAVIISGDLAKKLNCNGKMPGYNIQRISWLEGEYTFEYTTSTTRADKCVFRLDLYRNTSSNKNSVDFERKLNP